MLLKRQLEEKLRQLACDFPALAILGPRQSGKSTLAKVCFPEHTYWNLEELDLREFAREDPRGFLQQACPKEASGAILDEPQHVPELFSYLQTLIDKDRHPGRWILTGSQNFHLNEKIMQTLAGRIAITTLLPLGVKELTTLPDLDTVLFQGFYPELHKGGSIDPYDWHKTTYTPMSKGMFARYATLQTSHFFNDMSYRMQLFANQIAFSCAARSKQEKRFFR